MAGLCGLRILLIAAGLIGAANCQVTGVTGAGPSTSPTSVSPSSTATSPSSMSASPSSKSVSPSSKAASPSSSQSPVCQYAVNAFESGVQFTFENVTEGYVIQLTEENTYNVSVETVSLNHTHQTHTVLYLKPSTVYNYSVQIANDNTSNATCGPSVTVKTNKIDLEDINEQKCNPYICYETNWDIGFMQPCHSQSMESCKMEKKYQCCVKPTYTDICTNLTTNFSSSLRQTAWIDFEFLNTTDIKLEVNTLPPQIIWTNKAEQMCPDLDITFNCQERSRFYEYPHYASRLNEGQSSLTPFNNLEPFTRYNCTGEVKSQNSSKTITKEVDINCDLTLKVTTTSSNKSINLNWETTSQRCPNVSHHPNVSYTCHCLSHLWRNENRKIGASKNNSCIVDGLNPFNVYICKIYTLFKNKRISNEPTATTTTKTTAGVPSDLGNLKVTLKGNNFVIVTCEKLRGESWNGPEMVYIASLTDGKTPHNINNSDCSFQFKDLSYSTTYIVSVAASNKVFTGGHQTTRVDTLYNDKALIGFLVFLILLTSVALAFVLYKIYILHRRKSHQDEGIMLISSINDEDQLMRVEPIRAELLLDAYKKKVADEGRLFLAEFQSIPRIFSRNTMKEAKRSHNAVKNRYVDILPYDYNRVQLTTGNGETGCDYINASFINGFRESKKYIAAQGPKDETVADFWRMVWEQKSSIIVMVTRCEEGSRAKCAQYWPSAVPETEVFEEFVVKLCKEEQCPDYIIRCLTVSNKGENLEREVTQIQFISWPDHGVPEEPQLLLKLRKRVNTFKNLFSGPIVVHCSAGVGRTGTYIGIDAMMEGLESEGQVDIYGYIVNLRKQRCLMVQVETQYILIHQAMIEHNQFGETEISLSEFHSALSMLAGEPNLLQEEFKRLPKYNNWRTCNTGLTEENKKKNRFSAVIPYDYNRVLVKLDEDLSHNANLEDEDESSSEEEEDEDSMKYINASHIDGYWGPGGLVTAQSPLANTAGDFWLMVYQKRATAVVMMSDCTQGATELCSPYWDENKKAFLDVEVEVIETESTPAVTIRTMNIYHTKRKESRRVKQFHFLQWPSQQLPENSIQLMEMIRTIKQTCGYGNGPLEGQGPVVVHCSNGSYCSGVFCALWNLLDAGHTERTVDVFQAAKALRKQRQGMISSLEQYRFLYEAVAAAFPVQNGDVTSAVAAAAAAADDSVIIVNETGHILEDPAGSSATGDQQVAVAASEAAASIPLLERSTKEEEQDEATKTTAVDAASNGSTVTMEV